MVDDAAFSSLRGSAVQGSAVQGSAVQGEGLAAEPAVALAGSFPPDAAARDAARREQAGESDGTLSDAEFHFVTRGVGDLERAAVIAVLSQVRHEETQRVRRVERREHQPWARSQRVPEGIADLLTDP